jgi:Family of unknown function (DUF6518)
MTVMGDRASVFRLALLAVVSVAAGTVLGAVGRLSDQWPHEPRLLFALGAPWLVAAFAVGALSRDWRLGALSGALSLALSVLVYYAVMYLVEQRAGAGYALRMTVLWGGAATLVGAALGAAGASARGANRLWPTALLGGALAGEGLLFLMRGETGSAATLLLVLVVTGLTLPLIAGPRNRRSELLAATTTLALTALVIDAGLRIVMRRYGWGGY